MNASGPFVIEGEPPPRPAVVDRMAVFETEDAAPINPVIASPPSSPASPQRSARIGWAALALGIGLLGLCGLLALLWIERLLEANPAAGVAATLFIALVFAGLFGLAWGELRALSQLSAVREIRHRLDGDRSDLARMLERLARTLERRPALAPGVARWRKDFRPDHPAPDMLALFDGAVLKPADAAALAAARRSVRISFGLVAISPTALSDTVLFWYRALRIVREVAEIYGYRPSRATTLLLAQRALKDAGLIAGTDFAGDAISHFLGGKLLERVSTAAAEGAVGAYRMGRFALLVIEACRPLPFADGQRPKLLDLLPRLPS